MDFVNRDVGKFKNADLMCSFCDRILKTGGEKLSDSEVRQACACWFSLGRIEPKVSRVIGLGQISSGHP